MTPTTQELPRDTWSVYFDDLNRHLGTVKATVEIDAPDIGAQIEAEGLVLTGITYDHKDDIVVIGLDAPGGEPEDLQHIVYNPKTIFIAPGEGGELSIDIKDGEDRQHIISIERLPALPPA